MKKEDWHRQGSSNEGGDDQSDNNIHMKELKQIVILIHDLLKMIEKEGKGY